MVRINISVSPETAKLIEEQAKQTGRTVSSTITDAIKTCSVIREGGYQINDLVNALQLNRLYKVAGAIPVPRILLDRLVSSTFEADEQKTLAVWEEAGNSIGIILKTMAPEIDDLSRLLEKYSNMLPADSIRMTYDAHSMEIVLTGIGFSYASSKCTVAAIEKAMESYDFTQVKTDVLEGSIRVVLKKNER